jgi:histidinol-phosphate aminotransferase
MTSPRPRDCVSQIPAYVAGRPPQPRDGMTTYKLSSNENPYPPLPGSVGLIYQLVQAFCEPGDEVVYAWRSFEAYPTRKPASP